VTKTIKAERVTIELGSVPVNVYQLPDGSYRLAGKNITDAVKEDDKALPRLYGVKSLKDLPGAGSESGKESVKISAGKEGVPFFPVSIEDATRFWFDRAKKGNELAGAIVEAALIESIERRADKAFGKARSEAEYNERFKNRVNGILTRRSLCDAIKEYLLRHPELSPGRSNNMYTNATQKGYRLMFGRDRKTLETDLGAEPGKLRDALLADELKDLDAIENLAMKLIDNDDMDPCDAIDEAFKRLVIPVRDRGRTLVAA
jgi:hypothetical protein